MSDVLRRLLVHDRSVFPASGARLAELARDLTAFTAHLRSADEIDAIAFLSRPTVLRRLAGALAPLIPAGVDRLAGVGDGAGVLTAAVALETGLPLALLESSGEIRGEVHSGETVLLLAVRSGTELTGAARLLSGRDVRVAAGLTVLGPRPAEDWPAAVPPLALFATAVGEDGRLAVTAEETP